MAAQNKLRSIISQLDQIIESCIQYEGRNKSKLAKVHRRFTYSARNLLHYRALRTRNLRRLQNRLRNLGMSRLAKVESYVLPSLMTTRQLAKIMMNDQDESTFIGPELSIKKTRRLLKRNVRALLNKRPKRRRSRIMVTMPAEAADIPELIRKMILAGMNAARINCAHDDQTVWKKIIGHIRLLSEELSTPCVVTMDLGGPKIRTGAIEPGPQVVKVRPPKNARGEVIKPAEVWLGPGNPQQEKHALPFDVKDKLTPIQLLYFIDARQKRRTLMIVEAVGKGYRATLNKTSYFETGMKLYHDAERTIVAATIGQLPAIEGSIYLAGGSKLKLMTTPVIARHVSQLETDQHTIPELQCTNAQIIDDVNVGEQVVLDDGKFEGKIAEIHQNHLLIDVTHVRGGGAKLRADKGINFPGSKLTIRGLTNKDREDLKFVVQHADVVNMSFVNSARDVDDLLNAIYALDPNSPIGVVLKIETEQAFRNLTEILLAGMQTYPLGIMIARGDLALEVGWRNLATTQREIMKLCHAAHVPDIWATQVFESLAKQGIPSRAEMTDVWVAQQSECVMLNKGPFIIEAIEMLDAILTKMEPYRDKNDDLLPMIKQAVT